MLDDILIDSFEETRGVAGRTRARDSLEPMQTNICLDKHCLGTSELLLSTRLLSRAIYHQLYFPVSRLKGTLTDNTSLNG